MTISLKNKQNAKMEWENIILPQTTKRNEVWGQRISLNYHCYDFEVLNYFMNSRYQKKNQQMDKFDIPNWFNYSAIFS